MVAAPIRDGGGGADVGGPVMGSSGRYAAHVTSEHIPGSGPREQLLDLRGSIDNLDAAIIHLLAERFKCTQEVGRLKAKYGLPPSDPQRETSQISRLRQLAEESRLDPEFAETFLTFIINEVVRHHHVLQRGAE
jgi:chorismate mutase